MGNPTLPHDTRKLDFDDMYLEVDGLIVDGKQILKSQEATILDAATTTAFGSALVSNTGIVRKVVVVDCSADGTATEKTVATIPAQSLLLSVEGKVTTVFNGGVTQTYEVGLTGNTDQYLDPSDTDPTVANELKNNIGGANNDVKVVNYLATAEDFVLTYTNTTSATTGEITVTIHYVELADIGLNSVDAITAAIVVDLDLHKTAINAILTALENHGILADA